MPAYWLSLWADAGFRKKKRRAYADLAARARFLIFVSTHSRDRFLELVRKKESLLDQHVCDSFAE